jgi:intron-binding protein aquarius
LGQYVFEMTNAKVQQLRAERGLGEDVDVLAAVQEMDEEEAAVGDVDGVDGEVETPVDGFEAEE